MDFNTNLTEKGILIVNTAHCTNRAENPVFIEILISVVLVQCSRNTALIKISINTGLSVLLVQCAVFIIKFPFSVKFVLKPQQIHTTN